MALLGHCFSGCGDLDLAIVLGKGWIDPSRRARDEDLWAALSYEVGAASLDRATLGPCRQVLLDHGVDRAGGTRARSGRWGTDCRNDRLGL
jgi:hypothetical protein